tara:strand:- start:577 stop:813 length:237 start_codon:yes stop_codon:yes gene_type:complete
MNKIKLLLLALTMQSCMLDELPYIYYQGYCDCVYFDIDAQEMVKLLLRPGTYEVGRHTLTRTEYCEDVFKGTLANCKS